MLSTVVKSRTLQEMIEALVMFILLVLLSTFLLRFFWNRALVKHISVLKPLNTLLDALMLSLAINILR